MRRQDEIVSLYGGQSPLARKFLLSQMEGLARAFDSEELLDLLQGELTCSDATISSQALYSISQFIPGLIQRRYAVSTLEPGTWTAYGAQQGVLAGQTRRSVKRTAQAPAIRQAAVFVARPIIDGLLGTLSRLAGWGRIRAVLSLGHFGLASTAESLIRRFREEEPDLALGLSLVELETPDSLGAIEDAIRRFGASRPDLYLLVALLPASVAHSLLIDSISKAGPLGRMNLARALSCLPANQAQEAFGRLSRFGEGWVDIFGLAALECLGSPELLPTVISAYRSPKHPFLRLQALKTAGGILGHGSIEFCLDALKGADHRTCAVALESLVRLATPIDVLANAARPYLTSSDIKARVNAILASVSADDAPEASMIQDMLWSTKPLWRLEAAYCLGYLQSGKALELLGALATVDPSYVVRHQAVKSLSKYSAGEALPHLIPVVEGQEPRLALVASRVMGRYESGEACQVGESIGRTLARPVPGFIRGLLYRTLGSIVARSEFEQGREMLTRGLEDTDIKVLQGVLDGWALAGLSDSGAGGEACLDRLRALSKDANPRTRARAALALWHAGETDAVHEIAQMVASPEEETSAPALSSALEMSLLLSDVALGIRFPRLTRRAKETMTNAEYTSFTVKEGTPATIFKERPVMPEIEFEIRKQTRRDEREISTASTLSAEASDGSGPSTEPTVHRFTSPGTGGLASTRSIVEAIAARRMMRDRSDESGTSTRTSFHGSSVNEGQQETHLVGEEQRPVRSPIDQSKGLSTDLPEERSEVGDLSSESSAIERPPDDGSASEATDGPAAESTRAISESTPDPANEAPARVRIERTAHPSSVRRKNAAATMAIAQPHRSSRPRATDTCELKAFLKGQPAVGIESSTISDALGRATYLVSEGLSSGSRLRQWMARPSSVWLVCSVLLVLLIALLWTGRPQKTTKTTSKKASARLLVVSAEGPCWGEGAVLQPETRIATGSALQTGAGGQLIVATPAGNRVTLKATSMCIFDSVTGATGHSPTYRFSSLSGEVSFEFSQDEELSLTVGKAEVMGRNACLRVIQQGKACSLTVVSGEARVRCENRETRLVAKQVAWLE